MMNHILDSLHLRAGDVVWIVVPFALHQQYEHEFEFGGAEGLDVRVIPFKLQTRGSIETLFIGLQHMHHSELSRRTLCLDCDNIYFSDVIGTFRGLPREQGCCFYFRDEGLAPIYSYLDLGLGLERDGPIDTQ